MKTAAESWDGGDCSKKFCEVVGSHRDVFFVMVFCGVCINILGLLIPSWHSCIGLRQQRDNNYGFIRHIFRSIPYISSFPS